MLLLELALLNATPRRLAGEYPMKRLSAWLTVLLLWQTADASQWPQWRGASGRGVTDAKKLPIREADTENVLWKVPLPGRSSATPALWQDRLFVSSPDGKDLFLYSISTAGKILWKRQVGTGNRVMGWNSKNNFATPSP